MMGMTLETGSLTAAIVRPTLRQDRRMVMGETHDQDTKDRGATPGHIPEPKERSWRDEPANPYEGVSKEDPFEGRPPTEVVQPDEPQVDRYDDPGANRPLPPGQPLPRQPGQEQDDT